MAEYIEREALAEFLKGEIQQCEAELVESNGEDERYEQAVESRMIGLVDAWRKVTNTATADVVEVRHGKWGMRGGLFRCSVCDGKALLQDVGGTGGFSHEYEQVKSAHCPHCFAKMDGKDVAGNG